jgi:hypothetical protein
LRLDDITSSRPWDRPDSAQGIARPAGELALDFAEIRPEQVKNITDFQKLV